MADKIQTIIPRYGELNRIYRDYIDNHVFSFDRQKYMGYLSRRLVTCRQFVITYCFPPFLSFFAAMPIK